jgi:hypothetical protein
LEKHGTEFAALKSKCPFYTDAGTCQHIDDGVGLPIIVDVRVCEQCNRTKDSKVVQHWIYGQRIKHGLKADKPRRKPTNAIANREYEQRKNIADELLKIARTVPRKVDAPIIASAEDRLAICEGCDYWRGERCRAACGCKDRPRPMAETGRDCPNFLWRRV